MAQLWGGRFTKETDQLVYNFNASITFDQKFYKEDIEGSMAHVKMLAAVGVLTDTERDEILGGLTGILNDVESGKLEITSEYEDVSKSDVIKDIAEWNKNVYSEKHWAYNPWTSWFYFKRVADDMKMIEMEGKTK